MKKKVIILLLVLLVIIGTSAGIFILYNQAVADKKRKLLILLRSRPRRNQQNRRKSLKRKKSLSNRRNVTPPAETSSSSKASEIQSRLEQLVNTEYNAGGSVAICTGRVDENDLASVNSSPMQAASLIKLYVAGCVYENYEKVTAYDSYGGETENLIKSMITVSDNTSCNTLVNRLGDGVDQNGMALVNQYCTAHGFSDTHMGRLMLHPNDIDDNYTSVKDCCNFLKMANAGQLEGASTILDYMNQQERRGKIPSGLPAGVSSGNKTGELSDVENDAAIVYADSGTYVLCVMSQNLSDAYTARQFIIRTSSVVYEMM